MIDENVRTELLKQIDRLPLVKQQRVLRFARLLGEGVPGDRLLRFAGTMTHDEAQEFLKAIEEGWERIPQCPTS